MQLTFGDTQGLGKCNQTRREIFLYEMDPPAAAVMRIERFAHVVGAARD
jgi:hypothetical protein